MQKQSFSLGPNDAGQRADRFLSKALPEMPAALIQKAFRKKDVKLGGKPCKPEQRLPAGGALVLYAESITMPKAKIAPATPIGLPRPEVIYEDSNILILNKPAGLLCQPGSGDDHDTLIDRVKSYLIAKREYNPSKENTFAPALCHRLDFGTEGLMIAAKTAAALREICERLKNGEIKKTYKCVVHGLLSPPSGVMEDFLFKDAKKGLVYVREERTAGAKTAVLNYKTLKIDGKLSLLEIGLQTGRTHQIRVQLASRGHPLLGDGKYGSAVLDRPYKRRLPALCAIRLEFRFTSPTGSVDDLNGRVFEVKKTFSEIY